jgi:hypothetical protein
VAWHWRSLGLPFRLITRVGARDAPMFLATLDRHGIDYGSADAIVRVGPSASIDIAVLPDREIWMDQYVPGAIVGWPGAPDDAGVGDLRRIVERLGTRLVVTFGSRGVLVVHPTADLARLVAVEPVPVAGTTVGCGDAFIAYLLAEWWTHGDLLGAIERGKIGGAMPTAWKRPLPDEAYGSLLGRSAPSGT